MVVGSGKVSAKLPLPKLHAVSQRCKSGRERRFHELRCVAAGFGLSILIENEAALPSTSVVQGGVA
jgi:hypothetical protein